METTYAHLDLALSLLLPGTAAVACPPLCPAESAVGELAQNPFWWRHRAGAVAGDTLRALASMAAGAIA
jgi:hypothetical protein